jgi:hypothetical protein
MESSVAVDDQMAMLDESLPRLAHRRLGPVQMLGKLRVRNASSRSQVPVARGRQANVEGYGHW